jgi:hypothetical protein
MFFKREMASPTYSVLVGFRKRSSRAGASGIAFTHRLRKGYFMTTANTNASAARVQMPAFGYLLLLAVLLLSGLYALVVSGPAMHAAAREQLGKTLADENREVCAMFAARSGDAFTACSRALAVVRQKQTDRDNAAAQGMP